MSKIERGKYTRTSEIREKNRKKGGLVMSGKTKIPWTERTWNPVVGCTKCSLGCLNCYAERMAKRQVAMGCARGGDNTATWEAYSTAINPKTGKWSGDIRLRNDQLDKPLHWKKPCNIFVCSMSDLFHPKVPFEFIDKIFRLFGKVGQGQHTYQILTKRPKRMQEYIAYAQKKWMAYWPETSKRVHLGVSISTQAEADEKIPILLQIPAAVPAVRFLSIEPMLEKIDILKYLDPGTYTDIWGIRWIIAGCESGPKKRPCKKTWIYDIFAQCKIANVPCFVKQINVDGKVVKMPKEFPQEYPN